MKKFSFIVGLFILVSCKSSKSGCDAYGNNTMKGDSIKIKIEYLVNEVIMLIMRDVVFVF